MLRRPLLFLLLVVSFLPALAQSVLAQKERHFNFRYTFTLKNVSPGQRVRVWIPLAHSDSFQDVTVVSRAVTCRSRRFTSLNMGTKFCTLRLRRLTRASTSFP